MQRNLKYTHINERFKERFGREFTAQDRRNLIQLVSEGKVKIVESKYDKDKRVLYCTYEGKKSIFIVSKNVDFITYFEGK